VVAWPRDGAWRWTRVGTLEALMGGTSVETDGHLSATYLYDTVGGGERLQAVVFWRHEPDRRSAGFPLVGMVRALLGRRRPAAPVRADWHPPAGWSGSGPVDGRREVLIDRRARVLRVLDTDHAVPDDATLVLLVDDRAGAAVVSSHVVATRLEAGPGLDRAASREENLARLRAHSARGRTRWLKALCENAAVRAFLDASAEPARR
jgi:hypothetical protein